MIDLEKLKNVLIGYKEYFPKYWKGESFKWVAVKHFQDHWDIDAPDFGKMFEKATGKTGSLLASGNAFPRGMILNFAAANAEETRLMFRNLFDESRDLGERVTEFMNASEQMRAKYDDGTWRNHYQNTNAVSTYLWLRYPDKYYIYKFSEFKSVSEVLNADKCPKANGTAESMLVGYALYDELCEIVKGTDWITSLLKEALTDACYSDPLFKTLTIDIGFYVSRYYAYSWGPADYDSGISKEQWIELLKDLDVFTPGALTVVRRIKDFGGAATCKQLAVKYGEDINFYNSNSSHLAMRVAEKTGCPIYLKGSKDSRYWPILYLGRKATAKEDGAFVWKLRDELSEALDMIRPTFAPENEESQEETPVTEPNYWWLSASPKIWSFENLAVGEEVSYSLYNENGHKRQIFRNYQNAKTDDLVIGYEATPVKKIVALAKVAKESNGKEIVFVKTEDLPSPIEYQDIKNCEELRNMEFFSNPNGSLFKLTQDEYDFLMDMIREMNPTKTEAEKCESYTKEDFLRDVFMSSNDYNKLIGLIEHKMNVILKGAPGVGKTYAAKRLAYSMMGEKDDSRVELIQFHQNYSYEDFILGYRPEGGEFKLTEGVFYRFCRTAAGHPDKKYFFIIDEINRGNLSKILGELMVLIEKDYRGVRMKPAYSDIPFSVPENLYIIGMMNTADRSLALIDYALRRRFSFFEMAPAFDSNVFKTYQADLKSDTFNKLIEAVKNLNTAIEEDSSLGAGFRIGHSYFCGLTKETCTRERLCSIVEYDIIPMLEEYWFDDAKKLKEESDKLLGCVK